MRRPDVLELFTLAALWGGSSLFMRVAAPPFGSVASIALRVAIASYFLISTLASRGGVGALRTHWLHLLTVGVLNSIIPFCLFAYVELTLTAGFTSVLNVAAPLFAAIVAFTWLGERMPSLRVLGLVIDFIGVIVPVGGSSVIDAKQDGVVVAAALSATVLYGVTSSYTKRFLTGVPPLAVVTGSQVAATIVPAPLTHWLRSAQTPVGGVWLHVITPGIACMGVAYTLFFRLVAHVGPTRVMSVTLLIPVLGVLWGILFLGEQLTLNMVIGCAVILPGISLSTGVFTPGKKATINGTTPASDEDLLLRSGRWMANERTGYPGRNSLFKAHLEPALNCSAKFMSNAVISSFPRAHCDGLNSVICNGCHATAIALKFIQWPGCWLRNEY